MVKKIAVTVVVVVVALIVVLSVQTARFASKQVSVPPAELVAVDSAAAAERLAGALRFQTVSYQDPSRISPEAFLGLRAHLERSFPRVHASLSRETVSEYSLIYTWQGRDAS